MELNVFASFALGSAASPPTAPFSLLCGVQRQRFRGIASLLWQRAQAAVLL